MAQILEFNFTILNWNVAGAKYLEEKEAQRVQFKRELNDALQRLVRQYNPDVVTLQEIVKYGPTKDKTQDIIDPLPGYNYHAFPLIDSESLSIRAKWNKLEISGDWQPRGQYFAQGNGFLFREGVPHQPVWALPRDGVHKPTVTLPNYVEKVGLESGLYFGDRNTEPRAALVAHFVFKIGARPLDVFVVNVHLTTLTKEREGVPVIDKRATTIRMSQLDVIFDGIVSPYNSWRRDGFPERGTRRQAEDWESFDRCEPVWVLAGDFNSTPTSVEYRAVEQLNFLDVVPTKGSGTKASGAGKPATLTLDYIFAGPAFLALNPVIVKDGMARNVVIHQVMVSDHFPMIATIPVQVRMEED